MLSRIFVSLLILSALTSDGTINLTEYLFGPYLHTGTGFVSVSEKRSTCLDEENNFKGIKIVKDNDGLLFNTAYSSSYIIKAKNYLNKFCIAFNYVLYLNMSVDFHSKIYFRPLSFKKDKKIVLNSSDLSPPIM
ncbi:MAG TPA: hypothetical protein GX727_06080 [Clostridium sp.]|jgi:hypothetical protein|nr:hypothetical protein [Clostridium sp.]